MIYLLKLISESCLSVDMRFISIRHASLTASNDSSSFLKTVNAFLNIINS